MGAVNLAIVFGPGICPDTNMGISPDLGIFQNVVKVMISNAGEIFPERTFPTVEDVTDSSTSVNVSIQSSSDTLVAGPQTPVEALPPMLPSPEKGVGDVKPIPHHGHSN